MPWKKFLHFLIQKTNSGINYAGYAQMVWNLDLEPAMLGLRSRFQTKVKAKSPQAKGFHCIIHRYALA